MNMKCTVALLAVCVYVTMAQTTETTYHPKFNQACACSMQYSPVCGANGQTYGNDCMLRCQNVDFMHQGSCEDDVCICTMDYKPVCGDDGVTYINDCGRQCKGVKFDHEGSCIM